MACDKKMWEWSSMVRLGLGQVLSEQFITCYHDIEFNQYNYKKLYRSSLS